MNSDPQPLILLAVLLLIGFVCAVSLAMLFSKKFYEEFGFSDYTMLLGSVVLLASFLLNTWSSMGSVSTQSIWRDPIMFLVALPATYVVWLIVRFVLIDPLGRNYSQDD